MSQSIAHIITHQHCVYTTNSTLLLFKISNSTWHNKSKGEVEVYYYFSPSESLDTTAGPHGPWVNNLCDKGPHCWASRTGPASRSEWRPAPRQPRPRGRFRACALAREGAMLAPLPAALARAGQSQSASCVRAYVAACVRAVRSPGTTATASPSAPAPAPLRPSPAPTAPTP